MHLIFSSGSVNYTLPHRMGHCGKPKSGVTVRFSQWRLACKLTSELAASK